MWVLIDNRICSTWAIRDRNIQTSSFIFRVPVLGIKRYLRRGKQCVVIKYPSILAVAAGLFAAGHTASAAGVNIKLEPYVMGINAPLAMVQPKGDKSKFVLEQFGRIRIIDASGELLSERFLDIRSTVPVLWADFDERGIDVDKRENGSQAVEFRHC